MIVNEPPFARHFGLRNPISTAASPDFDSPFVLRDEHVFLKRIDLLKEDKSLVTVASLRQR